VGFASSTSFTGATLLDIARHPPEAYGEDERDIRPVLHIDAHLA
jgi:hypothetical protein